MSKVVHAWCIYNDRWRVTLEDGKRVRIIADSTTQAHAMKLKRELEAVDPARAG